MSCRRDGMTDIYSEVKKLFKNTSVSYACTKLPKYSLVGIQVTDGSTRSSGEKKLFTTMYKMGYR